MIIGIVGLGLIGGSLGLDLRSLGHSVLGVSRRIQTCDIAIKQGVVDDASIHLNSLAAAELIFICTPLADIESTIVELAPHLAPETVLTDVGSVKTVIVENVTPLWKNFVGGHPMAGKAESGLDAAQAQLFAGRPYLLTPTEVTPTRAVQTVETIAHQLKAQVHFCDPEEHDRAVAWISHLPVFTSASLIAACLTEADPAIRQLAQAVASSGFFDTSRVGGGNPELGVMMARYNREALLRSLMAYQQTLDHLITQIKQEDWMTLETELKQTQQARANFIH